MLEIFFSQNSSREFSNSTLLPVGGGQDSLYVCNTVKYVYSKFVGLNQLVPHNVTFRRVDEIR